MRLCVCLLCIYKFIYKIVYRFIYGVVAHMSPMFWRDYPVEQYVLALVSTSGECVTNGVSDLYISSYTLHNGIVWSVSLCADERLAFVFHSLVDAMRINKHLNVCGITGYEVVRLVNNK